MAHPKGLLIERAQRLGLERPEFNTAKTGPEHEPLFLTDVIIGGEVLGTGQGGSKRVAERAAAEEALAALEEGAPEPPTRRGGAQEERSASPAPAKRETPAERPPSDDEPFSGPWPMLEDVLASALLVAEKRVQTDLRDEAALTAIREFALRLYKDLLADLGEVVEVDDEEEGEEA